MKTFKSSPARISYAFVHCSKTLQHVNDTISPFDVVTNLFELDDADCYHRSDIFSDFQTARWFVIESMTLHYSLKLKLAVILVQWSSMWCLPRGLRMCKWQIPGHFSSPTWYETPSDLGSLQVLL